MKIKSLATLLTFCFLTTYYVQRLHIPNTQYTHIKKHNLVRRKHKNDPIIVERKI